MIAFIIRPFFFQHSYKSKKDTKSSFSTEIASFGGTSQIWKIWQFTELTNC